MKNTYYRIDLWEEQEMEYGIGAVHVCDTFWQPEKIKEMISNWRVMENLKEINVINVIKRLDGSYYINQVSGYTYNTGMYCYMVFPDGALQRAI